MLGKPCMRTQCHLAIDALPDSALGEALESLRTITEFHDECSTLTMSLRDWKRFTATLGRVNMEPCDVLRQAAERYNAATGE